MSENVMHAGLLILFVALCLFAAADAGRQSASSVAAKRAALVAAQQDTAPRRGARVAVLQTEAAQVHGQ